MTNENTNSAAVSLWEVAKTIYLSTLRSEEEKSQAQNYFSMITTVSASDDAFTILTSNKFAADFLQEKYADKLKSALVLAGADRSIELSFKPDENSRPTIIAPPPPTRPQTPNAYYAPPQAEGHPNSPRPPSFISSSLPLEDNFTFDEFVQGPSNSWAYAAARGVANHPGAKDTNPLFIHGGTGLGKTHLMQAIGNEIKRTFPQLSICYLTAELFLNEYVNAVMNKDMKTFQMKFRNVDVLLIDDIQFLQKGKQCQDEFFNTFNYLTSNHKQIVMTSDVAPKNLPALEKRLISRFEGGMVQEIEAPQYETRLAILKKKAEIMSPSISQSTLEFLAMNIKSHVRAIEGALAKVHIASRLNPAQELNSTFLSFLLKDVIEKEQSMRKLTVHEIQESVAKRYNVSVAQILSSDRTQSLVTPRQLAMYIARKFSGQSLQEISTEFDKKHATIIHGVKTIQKRLDVEVDLKSTLEDILQEFGFNISDQVG